MYLGIERRICPRHRIATEGMIWRRGFPRIECEVQNFSPAGAGLLLPEDIRLPSEFDLTFDRVTRHCILVWQQTGRVGLKYKSA
jgi:hypothetical protein